jgi:hypothetical protein
VESSVVEPSVVDYFSSTIKWPPLQPAQDPMSEQMDDDLERLLFA